MAVCGHCWVCGYKFDCYPDEAVTIACTRDACNLDHKICIPCHDAIMPRVYANKNTVDGPTVEEAGEQMVRAFTQLKEMTEAPINFKPKICSTYGWVKDVCPCSRRYPPPDLHPAGRVSRLTPRRWAFWTATTITIMAAKPFGMPWNWLPGLWCLTFSLLSLAIGHPWGSPRQFPGRPALGRLAGPVGPPCAECASSGRWCRHDGRRPFLSS